MECNEALSRVHELVDGQLDRQVTEVVRAHLASCASCALLHRDVSRLKGLVLAKFVKPPAPDLLASGILGRVRQRRALLGGTGARAAAAAAVVAGALALLAVFLRVEEPRLSHAEAASGCVDAFHKTVAGRADGEQASGGWRQEVLQEIQRATGKKIKCIPEIPNAEYERWEAVTVRNVKGVRIDFRPLSAPAGAVMPLKRCANPLISVFFLPLCKMDFCDDYLKELEKGHPCTRCIDMKDGSIFCFRSADCVVKVVSNLDQEKLLTDHQPEWRRAGRD